MENELIKSVTHCPTCGSECSIGIDGETHYYIPKQAQEGLEKLGEKIGDSEWDDIMDDYLNENGNKDCMELLKWLQERFYPPKSKSE